MRIFLWDFSEHSKATNIIVIISIITIIIFTITLYFSSLRLFSTLNHMMSNSIDSNTEAVMNGIV